MYSFENPWIPQREVTICPWEPEHMRGETLNNRATNLNSIYRMSRRQMRDYMNMMKQFGFNYSTAGENIAKGQPSAQSAMNGWMNSSSHRDNILGSRYSEIGVGFAKNGKGTTYWVQIFKG